MRRKLIALTSAAAAVALMASACSSSKSSGSSASGAPSQGGSVTATNAPTLSGPTTGATGVKLNVWLVSDPKDNPQWMQIINNATAAFKAKTGADINIIWQTWTNHLTNLDATLGGNGDVPDVIELGNTEAPKYAFNGALADVSSVKSTFDNNATWLNGLSAPCTQAGHLYCVPYYAGTRTLIYRTDLLTSAGVTTPPKTWADFTADLDKVKAANTSNSNFVTYNAPGKDWYQVGSFVYGQGGSFAVKGSDGKWKGNLEDPKSVAGLQQWSDLVSKYSTASSHTKDESDQDTLYETGNVFAEYDAAWHQGAVQQVHQNPNDPKSPLLDTKVKGKVNTMPLPGATADKPSPAFLGGSVLGIAQKSKYQALAAQWIQDYTNSASNAAEGALGNLPNNQTDLAKAVGPAITQQVADQAASSWFTPVAPNWADVESSNVLQLMAESIATGKSSVADAAKAADDQITSILNKS
jgi:N,N'-diacetylchitobiose transport system substrate-binding protein